MHPGTALRASLHNRGQRLTPQRQRILELFEALGEGSHLSAEQVHQRLLGADARVSLATVYRTVTTLVDQGVLHALAVEGGVSTYGLTEKPHHHAVCTECATMIEVPATRLSTALEHASEGSSFTLSEQAGLTLHGLCPDCQRRSGRP